MVWVVRQESLDPETDVYHQIDVPLGNAGVDVGPWSAADRRLGCCEEAANLKG